MNKWLIILGAYLFGVIATATCFGLGLARGDLHINSGDELVSMIAFCVFWPLTLVWIVFCFAVLFFLGWRGEPLRW
jgi:hypothetical protein